MVFALYRAISVQSMSGVMSGAKESKDRTSHPFETSGRTGSTFQLRMNNGREHTQDMKREIELQCRRGAGSPPTAILISYRSRPSVRCRPGINHLLLGEGISLQVVVVEESPGQLRPFYFAPPTEPQHLL